MRTLLKASGPFLPLFLFLSLSIALSATPTRAGEVTDRGVLKASVGDRPLSTETFTYERSSDSLIVRSELYQTVFTASGMDSVHKRMVLVMNAFDLGLRGYHSEQQARGHTWKRTLVPAESTLSSYREFDERGDGDVLALPPGRLYVLEGGLFSLFDVMTRSLADRTFESRPLTVVTLGPRDSLITITVRDSGRDTLRWGGRPVVARRLEFSDGGIRYDTWSDPTGRLLRLRQPDLRLQVDRQAPAIKPRAPRPRGR